MNIIEQEVLKRSERILTLFNSFKGQGVADFPGPLPPFSKYLNGTLLRARRGELELEFKLKKEWANPTGLLHGGMQGALIDDAIGMTTATLGYPGFLISIDSHLNYIGKISIDEMVIVRTKTLREGKNIVNMYCEILDKDGNLIAIGNSNLLKTQYTPDFVKMIDDLPIQSHNNH
ncbi:MAG: PaaI family thioesterase [Candidatus Lokiarchaeota archaeon]|nr:PaaI family thioesterase [Candidatus Lokiarchaeota archaeon]